MELDILTSLKKNDKRVQEITYKETAPYLFRVIFRFIGNEEKSGEILNDTFYKAFTKIDTFNNDSSKFLFWIKRIAINECLQFLRKKNKINFVELSEFEETMTVSDTDNKIDVEYYYELILNLPEQYRIVFNLAAIEGYTHKEISKKLNIAETTSRTLLLRARRILIDKIRI